VADDTDDVVPAEVIEDRQELDPRDLGIELPDDPEQAVQTLLRAIVGLRSEAGSYLEDLQRVAADFDNYRKRVLREQVQNVERAAERVIRHLLPVLDSLDAGLSADAESPSVERILEGVRGTRTLLLDVLADEGLQSIPSVGMPFDPSVHEAAIAPSEGEGTLVVTTEMRRGYTLHGRVLRAALVAVDHE